MAQQKLDLNREDEKVSVGEDAYEEKQLDVEKVSEEKEVKLEEVDLGYTDPIKKETEAKIEPKE